MNYNNSQIDSSLPFLYFKRSCPEHPAVKDAILSTMGDRPKVSIYQENIIKVSDSDKYTDQSLIERTYTDSLKYVLRPTVETFQRKMKFNSWNTVADWCNTYDSDDYDEWSCNNKSSFTLVYYMNVPENGTGIEFDFLDKIYQPLVAEGDVVIFPSWVWHRVTGDMTGAKTVIYSTFQFSTDTII